ncbi:hypothetical protein VIBNIWn13_p0177 [Vibrio nigripulchritudo Wn13]|nr:hypothetical protein VIBNIBLFn1_p0176 [Vibrio nigripulchritudo BLFn1]CCN97820.1 hypothetical protein VIBNIENn2_p0175 [Vibrio nigripulchritudo ENn2]CCO56131.1 hypothetical protein VIBNIWn13_p0177 [Vibrio nigripulchritudo Wn13]
MPFAVSNQTGQVVGIGQAIRGDDCDCRCLSCNTPVTARKGDVNQWHFSHRTDDASTSRECHFSPVTALALIVRQELHQLRQFDLDDWTFTDAEWAINSLQHGLQCDAYTQDAETNVSVMMEIPFANAKVNDVECIPDEIDIVLRVDTHRMANSLYQNQTKHEPYSSNEVFCSLLEYWEEWVSMERWPADKADRSTHRQIHSDPAANPLTCHTVSTSFDAQLCMCCGIEPGHHGKGLLCRRCVTRSVGTAFNSIADMVHHYKRISLR